MRGLWHALHDRLIRSTDTLSFQTRFRTLRQSSQALQRFSDPTALLDHMHAVGGEACERNGILRGLTAAAQRDDRASDAAVTLMLLALWPGLDAVHRRLSQRYRQNPEDLVSEISERATRGIRGLDLERVTWIAATLVRNTERDIRRALRAARTEAASRIEMPEEIPVSASSSALGLPDGLDADSMVDALACQVRDWIGEDADLVIGVAVLGERQHEAGERLGIGPAAARKRYQRAIRRVRLRLEECG